MGGQSKTEKMPEVEGSENPSPVILAAEATLYQIPSLGGR